MSEYTGERRRSTDNIEKETIVVTTEDGIVMTGSRAEAFEARVVGTLRKPLVAIGGLMFIMFVWMLGMSLVLTNLSSTVHGATGTEAQEQQSRVIRDLLSEMNCQDQRNLQRTIDQLVDTEDGEDPISIVEPQCVLKKE